MNELGSITLSALLVFSTFKTVRVDFSSMNSFIAKSSSFVSNDLFSFDNYTDRLKEYLLINKSAQENLFQVCSMAKHFWQDVTSISVDYDKNLDRINICISKRSYEDIYTQIKEFEEKTIHLRYTDKVWITMDTDFQIIA